MSAAKGYLSAIVAASPSGVIGKDGDMPWRLSTDLQRFKKLTMGGMIVMGRKTFESIGRPLPGRQNVVLSRSTADQPQAVEVVGSEDQLLEKISTADKVFVIGGASLYDILLPKCDEILLTRVFTRTIGDTHVELDLQNFRLSFVERVPQSSKNSVPTEFQVWRRRI